jgi:Ca2+-binding RTX toxin-like protein
MVGTAGSDTLDGASGDDLLVGELGKDRLTGGGDSDRFDFNLIKESRPGAAARDVITDFQHEQDTIDLSTMDADLSHAGNQTFSWIGSDAFSGDAGELRFARGLLQGDTDGDKRADLEIRVIGLVTAGDLIL